RACRCNSSESGIWSRAASILAGYRVARPPKIAAPNQIRGSGPHCSAEAPPSDEADGHWSLFKRSDVERLRRFPTSSQYAHTRAGAHVEPEAFGLLAKRRMNPGCCDLVQLLLVGRRAQFATPCASLNFACKFHHGLAGEAHVHDFVSEWVRAGLE